MPNNITVDGVTYSTEEITSLNGGAVTAAHMQRLGLAIRTGANAAIDLPGDAANGLDVDVTRIVDGADVTQGAKADAAATTDAGTFSIVALVKRILESGTTRYGAAGDTPPALATNASGFLGWLRKIVDVLSGSLTVTGPLTDAQLRASAVPASIADGSDVAIGAKADAAASSDTGSFSFLALFKRLLQKLTTQLPAALTGSGNLKVSVAESTATQTVTGTVATTAAAASQVDGHSASIGTTTDAEATGNGTLVAIQKRIRTLLAGGLPATLGGLGGLKTEDLEPETFIAVFDAITCATDKYMATLFNPNATHKYVIHRIWAQQWTVTAVVGVTNQLDLRRVTARTVGTTITPFAADLNDAINGGLVASHTDTAVTAATLIRKFFLASEEAKATAALAFNGDTQSQLDWFGIDGHLVWSKKDGLKGITLRQNQGITIQNRTGGVGALSFIFEFTEEPV